MTSPEEHAAQLAAEAIAGDDPTGWFEQIYAASESGLSEVRVEDLRDAGPPPARRWRAEFRRPAERAAASGAG